MSTADPLHILLVEADEAHVMAVRSGFRRARILNPIHVAHDGAMALGMLRASGEDALPRPLVLVVSLDLDLMRQVRADSALKDIPIYVLAAWAATDPPADGDQAATEALGVIGFGTADDVGDGFLGLLGKLSMGCRIVEFS